MSVFAILINPAKEERQPSARALVCSAAHALQIGEFQFVQLAYREWFGEDLAEPLVDGLFASYMLRNEVPHWARHHARAVLAGGAATARGPDPAHGSTSAGGARSFIIAAGAVALTMAVVIAAATMTTAKPTSVLPPYFTADEMPRGGKAR